MTEAAMAKRDAAALREVAAAADVTAREQRRAATLARQIADQRDRAVPWETIVEKGTLHSVVELLGSGAHRLRIGTSKTRRTAARGLIDEGLTTRQIGKRFGVSHQRISVLLSSNPGKED